MSSPVWFITGTSNGFGLLLALRALKAGHRVIGTVRNPEKAAGAVKQITDAGGKVAVLDLDEPRESIIKKVQDAEKIYGHIDYLINNAGFSVLGALENFTEDQVTRQYKTNVFGPLYAIQGALPTMRARRSGLIVNFSSVGGLDCQASSGLYGSTKFALEGITESLSREVAPFGIGALIIEPGAYRTNFLDSAQVPVAGTPEAYKGTVLDDVLQKFATGHGKQPGDPNKAVERIYEVISGEGEGGKLTGKVLRFPFGKDTFERVERKITKLQEDFAIAKDLETKYPTSF